MPIPKSGIIQSREFYIILSNFESYITTIENINADMTNVCYSAMRAWISTIHNPMSYQKLNKHPPLSHHANFHTVPKVFLKGINGISKVNSKRFRPNYDKESC